MVTTPFEAGKGIRQIPVMPFRNVFIAGKRFEYLKGKELDYKVLSGLPCIFLEKNTSTRTFMDRFLEEHSIRLTPEFELAISDMVVQFAKRNMGVGCVMEGFAREALERGEVFELKFRREMPLRQICVVTGDENLISLAGRSLFQMITGGEQRNYGNDTEENGK